MSLMSCVYIHTPIWVYLDTAECEVGLKRKKEEQKGNKIILSFKKKHELIMVVTILNKHSLIPTTLWFNEVFSVRPVEWHLGANYYPEAIQKDILSIDLWQRKHLLRHEGSALGDSFS